MTKKVLIDGKPVSVQNTKTVWSLEGPTPVWLGKFIFYYSIFLGLAAMGMEYFSEFIPEDKVPVIQKILLFSVTALAFLKKALGLKEK